MARGSYAHPPVEEGLCQFVFAEPLDWNVATPGLLYERLRDKYPVTPEGQEALNASFQVGPTSEDAATSGFELKRTGQRFIYRDDTRTRLLVVNEQLLSVNSLRPYEGWESLRERLTDGLNRVGSVCSLPAIRQVSMRYINRIAIPADRVDTDEYFRLPIVTADGGKAVLAGFLSRVESVLVDRNVRANITFGTAAGPENELAFILDLDIIREFDKPMTAIDASVVADELKELEDSEFEACITDRTRELFA